MHWTSDGWGLKELMELEYAPKAVEQIVTGKPISRAVRAHLLVDAADNTLIASQSFEVSV